MPPPCNPEWRGSAHLPAWRPYVGIEADTRLELLDEAGATLAESRDVSAQDRCSRITRDLAPGTYFLVVRPEGDMSLVGTSYVLHARAGE